MKAAPTLDGRLRIDLESKIDLAALQSITTDARSIARDLADRLADGITEPTIAADWKTYVTDELKHGFNGQLKLIDDALHEVKEPTGETLFITGENAMEWYGALNQARMALEERYLISDITDINQLQGSERQALMRAQFYQTFQSMIFQYLVKG